MPSKWLEQTRIAFFGSVKHDDLPNWIEIKGKTSKLEITKAPNVSIIVLREAFQVYLIFRR